TSSKPVSKVRNSSFCLRFIQNTVQRFISPAFIIAEMITADNQIEDKGSDLSPLITTDRVRVWWHKRANAYDHFHAAFLEVWSTVESTYILEQMFDKVMCEKMPVLFLHIL